jgi:hypothetical protein
MASRHGTHIMQLGGGEELLGNFRSGMNVRAGGCAAALQEQQELGRKRPRRSGARWTSPERRARSLDDVTPGCACASCVTSVPTHLGRAAAVHLPPWRMSGSEALTPPPGPPCCVPCLCLTAGRLSGHRLPSPDRGLGPILLVGRGGLPAAAQLGAGGAPPRRREELHHLHRRRVPLHA